MSATLFLTPQSSTVAGSAATGFDLAITNTGDAALTLQAVYANGTGAANIGIIPFNPETPIVIQPTLTHHFGFVGQFSASSGPSSSVVTATAQFADGSVAISQEVTINASPAAIYLPPKPGNANLGSYLNSYMIPVLFH